jgi:hypothetical protein
MNNPQTAQALHGLGNQLRAIAVLADRIGEGLLLDTINPHQVLEHSQQLLKRLHACQVDVVRLPGLLEEDNQHARHR